MAFDKSSDTTRTDQTDPPTTGQRGGQGRETRENTPPLSPPVEAVVRFGFPRHVVQRVYQRLKAVSHSGREAARSGNDVNGASLSPNYRGGHGVSAAVLLVAVDNATRYTPHGNGASHSTSDGVREDGPAGDDFADQREVNRAPETNDARSQSSAGPTGNEPVSVVNSDSGDAGRSPAVDVTSGSEVNGSTAEIISLEREAGFIGTVRNTSPESTQSRPHTSDHDNAREATATRETNRDRSSSPPRATHHEGLERLRALKVENKRLRARNTCRHCRQRPVTLTLLPCGHFCFCHECGSTFRACPVCRKTILADVRTFVA